MDDEIILNSEQEFLKNIIETSKDNIFITGKAGTGKSTLLNAITADTKKSHVVIAPTGMAAVNVGGQTIHSLFSIPVHYDPKADIHISKETKDILYALEMIIIDEISMVRADFLDKIDIVLREAKKENIPFGGVQMVMFGDMYQLAPVVGDVNLQKYLDSLYKDIYFFNALVWGQTKFISYELQSVFRQQDEDFKKILNHIREGTFLEESLALLNKRVNIPADLHGVITLTATNKKATEINEERLSKLEGKAARYQAEVRDWEGKAYPADQDLYLKEGAQVVFLRNDTRDNGSRWVNGTIGVVQRLNQTEIVVHVNDKDYTIHKETWQQTKYIVDIQSGKIEKRTCGSFTQFPLKLAWAITIHKAQGRTLDAVIIDLSGGGAFASGQTYVALSRCKSFDTLYLKRELKQRDIIIDKSVSEFMKNVMIIETGASELPTALRTNNKDYDVVLIPNTYQVNDIEIAFGRYFTNRVWKPFVDKIEGEQEEHLDMMKHSLIKKNWVEFEHELRGTLV